MQLTIENCELLNTTTLVFQNTALLLEHASRTNLVVVRTGK